MHYPFSLKTVGLLVGLLLTASHAFALARPEETRRWLAGFPRSRAAGVACWRSIWSGRSCWCTQMDWGEFYYLRTPMLIALPVFFYLTLRFVDEFLAARALGILALLAAAPLLDAAFLQPPVSRLLVVVLAYCVGGRGDVLGRAAAPVARPDRLDEPQRLALDAGRRGRDRLRGVAAALRAGVVLRRSGMRDAGYGW